MAPVLFQGYFSLLSADGQQASKRRRQSRFGLGFTHSTGGFGMRSPVLTRRDLMQAGLVGAAALAAAPRFAMAAASTINFADIGVGDPGGDWSQFTRGSGG